MIESILVYITCLLLMFVLVIGVTLNKKLGDKRNLSFFLIICANILYIVFCMVSSILEKYPNIDGLSYVINTICYLCADLLVLTFGNYVLSFLKTEVSKKQIIFKNIILITTIIRIILIIVFAATKLLFTIEQGVFTEGKMTAFIYGLSAIVLVEYIVATLANKNILTKKQIIVIILYELIPIPAILVELFFNLYSITIIAVTLSITLTYILLQNTTIETGIEKQNVLQEISTQDQLTGMKNRRAYYSAIDSLKPDENVAVIFCDINGLKHTNDHFGHAAGDKLIIKFSDILIKLFGVEHSFRISGDEFVVIIPEIDFSTFRGRVSSLKKTISNNNGISAYGFSYGIGSCISQLILDAETKMYEDKRKNKKETSI